MVRKLFIFLPALFLLFFLGHFPSVAYGSSVTLSADKTQLQSPDDVLSISVSLSINATDSAMYYLRGVFFLPGSDDYCGFTWNGNDWFAGPYSSNERWKNFLPITISNNSWQGTLKAKIDSADSGCRDSGTYNVEVERFTSGGSSNFDTQNVLSVSVVVPTPTPTPTPTPKPTPTSAPTATPIKSGPTPKPTHSPTPTDMPSASDSQNSSYDQRSQDDNSNQTDSIDTEGADVTATDEGVLGESTPSASLIKDSKNSKSASSKKPITRILAAHASRTPFVFLTIGGTMIILCAAAFFYYNKKREKTSDGI